MSVVTLYRNGGKYDDLLPFLCDYIPLHLLFGHERKFINSNGVKVCNLDKIGE